VKSLLQNRSKIALIMLSLLPNTSFASQIKLAADGAEIVGKLSLTEVNRISLVDDKIKSKNTSNSGYEFTNDSKTGDVYVRHIAGAGNEPLNVFLTSIKGYTYKLLLTPMDVPSEQIFIKNMSITKDDEIASEKEPLPYTQEIVDLMKAMKKGEIAPGYKVITKRESHFAKNGMKMVMLSVYAGGKYNGLIYSLTNKTKEPVALYERDFASNKNVRAVKFDSPVIGMGEAINIYIVADRS